MYVFLSGVFGVCSSLFDVGSNVGYFFCVVVVCNFDSFVFEEIIFNSEFGVFVNIFGIW